MSAEDTLALLDHNLSVLEQTGYDVGKVLEFVGGKPPEFFDEADGT